MGRLARPRNGPGTTALVGIIAALVAALLLLVALGVALFDPFATETVDRSGPALLERMRSLEEFTAAEATFVQDVDLEQDAAYLPDFLKGERVVALVTGQVRATVDFSGLDEDSVQVSEDGTTITVTLPEPELQSAEIEESDTKIVTRDRGLIDRLEDVFSSNPFDDSQLYEAAEAKLDEAAASSGLAETARENTEEWLETFLGAAGFEEVQVQWQDSPK
jgi:hypothetical protein